MPTNVESFCPMCGNSVASKSVCECGYHVATAGGPGTPDPQSPLNALVNAAWHRLYQVVTLEPATVELPIISALISLGARAVALAFVLHQIVGSLFSSLARLIARSTFGLIGSGHMPKFGWSIFGWALLSFCLATVVCLAVYYVPIGMSGLPRAAAALADAQWPTVLSVLTAWLLGSIWAPLGFVTLAVGVAWGQGALARGLAWLALPYRHRIGLHLMTVAVSIGVPLLIIGLALKNAMSGLM